MKTKLIVAAVLMSVCLISGCGEPFAAGFGTGAIAVKTMSDDAQERFIIAVNNLNRETEKLNNEIGAVKDIDIEAFIKPETIAAFESLKDRKNDPTLWIALVSLLLGGTGVNIFKNQKKRLAK